jgi:hypothetical protein
MLHKNLLDVLVHAGLTREGDAFIVPTGLSVTVYLDVADQALIVDRVVRVEIGSDIAVIVTHRKEKYAVEVASVGAVRFHPEATAAGYA